MFVPLSGTPVPADGTIRPSVDRAHEAQAQVVPAVVRGVPVAIRRPTVPGVVVPAAAPVDAVRTRRGTDCTSAPLTVYLPYPIVCCFARLGMPQTRNNAICAATEASSGSKASAFRILRTLCA
jgi:hypothetical protein